MPDSTSDTRDDVMQAVSLHELFCERTAAEFKPEVNAEGSGVGVAIFATLSALFYLANQPTLAKGCLAILGLQILIAVWTLVVRSPARASQAQDDARRGVFPPESAPVVLARLRWWNHLVTPRRWARQSRVHDRRFKLERRIQETRERIGELQAQQKESQAQARQGSAAAGAALAAKVKTLADREEHLKRLGQVEDELLRLTQELALYEALMLKITEVTSRLDRLEQLSATIYDAGSDLSRTVAEALNVLEERRQVVRELDAIDPDEFLRMITF